MAGQTNEDSIISEFITSIGPWSKFIVIGGGYALIIYKLYLAEKNNANPPVGTTDIDSLINRRVPKISEKSIAKHLQEAGFVQCYRTMAIKQPKAIVKTLMALKWKLNS